MILFQSTCKNERERERDPYHLSDEQIEACIYDAILHNLIKRKVFNKFIFILKLE
jgi:hypothetical protein